MKSYKESTTILRRTQIITLMIIFSCLCCLLLASIFAQRSILHVLTSAKASLLLFGLSTRFLGLAWQLRLTWTMLKLEGTGCPNELGGNPLISGHSSAALATCCACCDTLARFDTSTRVPLTADVGRTRRMTRLSHQPVDHASPSRFACMPHDGTMQNRDLQRAALTSAHAHLLALASASFSPILDFPHIRRIVWKECGYTAQSLSR